MVEEEAHTANLTQRVKTLLGVSDSSPSDTQPQNTHRMEELHSTIQEVGEELNEVEKGEKV
jgi:hypothetical protein